MLLPGGQPRPGRVERTTDDAQLLLGLSVLAAPELISPVRRFVASALRRVLRDDDLAYRMELASHELLDNATKYGLRRLVHLRITREAWQGGHRPQADPRQRERPLPHRAPRAAGDGHRARLRPDGPLPRSHECDTKPDSLALGLARVRAEGELDLDLSVDGGRVAVTVRAALGVKS